ncbi:MAG TPA: hypothetical protein VK846_07225 [Candidatus Limnocylindria bacterium]|nr:hypothetical protein [Candidatus Limnocylindria bacterium]
MKVKLDSFEERFSELDVQFSLMRFALSQLSKAKRNSFFQAIKTKKHAEENQNWDKTTEAIKELHFDNEDLVLETFNSLRKSNLRQISKRYGSANQYFFKQFSEDGLSRSELLLVIAHFEAFLKELHAAVLKANPSILALSKPNRQIQRESLFQYGYQKILEEEIAAEVNEVDRKSVKDRARYFEEKLGLKWGDEVVVKAVKDATDARNEISHENPNKVIADAWLADTKKYLGQVARSCFMNARSLYPKNFELS